MAGHSSAHDVISPEGVSTQATFNDAKIRKKLALGLAVALLAPPAGAHLPPSWKPQMLVDRTSQA